MASVLVEPKCVNHPDRPGIGHYSKNYEYSLCAECLDARLEQYRHEPLDEHARRMQTNDRRE